MLLNKKWTKVALSALSFMVVIIGWILFTPIQFGGNTAYVILTGNSMAPDFHTGDLVLTRSAVHYAVGDAVAYEHPAIGQVFHRIIAKDGYEFILQGDNNYWIDSFQPTKENILGKLWFRLPSLGRIISTVREPSNLAIFSSVLAATALFAIGRRNKGKNGTKRVNHKKREYHVPMLGLEERREEVIFTLLVIGIASLILGLVAFTRPLTRAASSDLMYQQSGHFSYSAEANPNVYDQETIQPGEPLFRNLTQIFDVEFSYEFSSNEPVQISGVRRLIAEVSDVNGWRRTIEMTPETEFDVKKFTFYSSLDLSEVQEMIDRLEEETGLDKNQYTLSIKPQISFSGVMSNELFLDEFSPELKFAFDSLQVHLMVNTFEEEDPLNPATSGSLSHSFTEANTISILGYELDVEAGRWISAVTLIISIAASFIFIWLLNLQARLGDAARVQMLYGPNLISISNGNFSERRQLVDVSTIDDLIRISERDDQIMLHQSMEDGHHFYVESQNVYYHFKSGERNGVEILTDRSSIAEVSQQSTLQRLLGNLRGDRRDEQWSQAYDWALEEWVKTLDRRNHESEGHTERVTSMTLRIAHVMGIRGEELEYVRRGALLHDVGMIEVPEAILNKPGPLDQNEWEIVRGHPEHANELLSAVTILQPSLEIPYYHHERWDGSGYPLGLSGEEIPLSARIFAVVDVWDSLQCDRPHRKGWSEAEIMDHIGEQSGTGFDPEVVEIFLEILHDEGSTDETEIN